jgi:hypothetical protein
MVFVERVRSSAAARHNHYFAEPPMRGSTILSPDEFGAAEPSMSKMTALRPSTIAYDVSGLAPEVLAVETLARLQLFVRRFGLELQLRDASKELQELLAFVGLGDVLRVEACGQTEEGEERLGVEEERELDDPPA